MFNTEAVVIRTVAYGETHAVLTLLTPSGKLAAMARGAKKPQSRLAAGSQLCAQGMYALYQGRGMADVRQVEVITTRRALRERLDLAAYAAYVCELACIGIEDAPSAPASAFQDFVGLLDRLANASDPPAVLARVWEAKVLRMLGAAPVWTRCVECGAPWTDTGWYHVQAGGLLCAACQTRYRGPGWPVSAAAARVLEQFSRVPVQRMGRIAIGDETCRVLDRLLRLQMSEYAGLSLRSRSVLDSLLDVNGGMPSVDEEGE
ncbi:DNA repair protein RecO [Alicyclobacillus cellulosilyticus]|uniref:DNA repair protein RecO n=1 Tax=Alicyclobacillus cellulosilyticus TaxID=1003997 RepID=UPI00166DB806|nr:DNA repair protein RecO [Alicyclobacillus cellulosilyticus]